MLQHIPCRSLNYQEWLNVGMALHQEGLPCSLWDDWSRDDNRYHPGECERKWGTFGNGETRVTMGTVWQMARDYGWDPVSNVKVYGFDDMITVDGEPVDTSGWHHEETQQMPPPPATVGYNAAKDITDYLSLVFEPEEKVSYVVNAYQDDDGKWKPVGSS